MKVKVRNLRSENGNHVPNQFVIEAGDGVYFQSYETVIAKMPRRGKDTRVQLDKDSWDYSRTTTKYLNQFLGTSGKKDIEERIATKRYRLVSLN